ncbi:helix-turn-helix transcriptional regulator [Pantoea agglomerans]|uniref:helix-turn-helix domain-containing protein n=1 Tax=Enterobacter agglomerans TaxID=549 RepID=UPI0028C4ECEB|nr:helix-turn-helix transcriptional regulator [Pantoea agglomerans]WNN32994.1 helix-turn-helix transcriptional regulator [Pantoea agglomerans]
MKIASMSIGKKLRAIREEELLNRRQAADLTGIPYGTLNNYEGDRAMPSTEVLLRLLQLPEFQKYALWLTTDLTAPEAGQVAPSDYVLRKVSKSETDGKKTG